MNNKDSKFSILLLLFPILCCGLPLLLLAGGGSILTLAAGFFTNNIPLLIIGLTFVVILIGLVFKRMKS